VSTLEPPEAAVIFCHCAVVGDREVARAVEDGAATVAEVCRTTGAGQQCGSCVFSVRRVLCDHQARRQTRGEPSEFQHDPVIGVDVAAS
jgi:bacterioferritin-associated ferredoxin